MRGTDRNQSREIRVFYFFICIRKLIDARFARLNGLKHRSNREELSIGLLTERDPSAFIYSFHNPKYLLAANDIISMINKR